MDDLPLDQLIQQARAGDQDALGEVINAHRSMLDRIADRELGDRLKGRLSSSDVVQQTCLSAVRHFDEFVGGNEQQFLGWLKAVHQRNIADVIRRHVQAQKRAVNAQQPLPSEVPNLTESKTASQRAEFGESLQLVLAAVDRLPEAQAQAVRFRFVEQLPLKAIAERMDRSEVAVAALLKRGLAQLRKLLPQDFAES